MRNILKGYHEIIAISVVLSSGPGGMATYVPRTGEPTLSSLPIGAQIVKVSGDYLIKYNNTTIGELELYESSGYELDDVIVKRGLVETSVTTTPITLQDGDIIYVAFRVAEILLARNPSQGYEMVWDGVDSIGFKFSGVSGNSGGPYSGEIWIADTDYGMQSLNQLGLYPNIIPPEADRARMAETGGNALYAPGITDILNVYENDSWYGGIDPSTYNGVPSQNWTNAHFVGLEEWFIIYNMFRQVNMWEAADGTSFANLTGVQIPGSYIPSSAYSYLSYDANYGTTTLSSRQVIGYIPGDYNSFWSSSSTDYPTVGLAAYYNIRLPQFYRLELEVDSPVRKIIELGKMRVLNTTKTNYSLDS